MPVDHRSLTTTHIDQDAAANASRLIRCQTEPEIVGHCADEFVDRPIDIKVVLTIPGEGYTAIVILCIGKSIERGARTQTSTGACNSTWRFGRWLIQLSSSDAEARNDPERTLAARSCSRVRG